MPEKFIPFQGTAQKSRFVYFATSVMIPLTHLFGSTNAIVILENRFKDVTG